MQQPMRSAEWLELESAAHAISLSDCRRVVRLMREYVVSMTALAGLPPAVAIFGSARTKSPEPDYQAAYETARRLAARGLGIITGGPGIMEAANRGAKDGGARSIGCPIHLERVEPANAYLDIAVPFTFFAPRKAAFLASACAFVVFPGGFGTLDELFEVLLAMQTHKLARVPLILYGSAFWRKLVEWLREILIPAGTIDATDPGLLALADDPREVVAQIMGCFTMEQRQAEAIEAHVVPLSREQHRMVEVAS